MIGLRIYANLALLFGIFMLASSAATAEGLIDESLPNTWQNESALRDVHFVDALRGWAVGDHGVILKTTDGGEHWYAVADVNRSVEDWDRAAGQLSLKQKLRGAKDRRFQAAVSTSKSRSPKVTCQLSSVFFLNDRLGWAAGGYAVPLLDRTRSVVLKTVDGGINWTVIANTAPPHIKQIEFSDPNTGWAIGDASASFASGIYFTRDGGRTWQDQPLEDQRQHHDWVAASRNGNRIIGVSSSGGLKFAELNRSRIDNSAVLADRKQSFSDVVMSDASNGWAVGAEGAVFQTRDQGLSWQAILQQDETNTIKLIDFETVTTTEKEIWAAGKPGSCLVSIDKQTGKVKLHATPNQTPLHRITFVDETHGWAVGDLGIVIATTDGGESWQVQRGDQTRIGLLNICFDAQETPLEMLSQLACEEDFLCGTVGLFDVDTYLQQAAGRCGNAVINRINLPDVEGAAEQQAAVIRKLVVEIRSFRPSCVVLNPSLDQSISESLDREKLLVAAIHQAANTTYEADQFTVTNLKPWQVQRMAIADIAGKMSIGGDKFLPQLAMTISDRIFISRSLLGLGLPTAKPKTYRVVRFLGRGAGGQSTTVVPLNSDLLTGLHGVPRRTETQHPPGNLSMLSQRNRKRESFKRILLTDVNDADSMFAWQNEMLSLLVSVDRTTAGNWLIDLADKFFETDQPELAAKTMDFLTQRIPEHAYTPSALLWLAAYHASEEYSQRAYFKAVETTDRSPVSANSIATRIHGNDDSVTKLQVNQQSNGDQELAWSVPDENLLKRQIKEKRKQRLADDSVVYSEEEKKLFELGDALAGKTEPTTQSSSIGNIAEVEIDQLNATQASATESVPRPPVQVSWTQFVVSRRQLAAKYLSRLRGRDPDLSLSDQTVAIELTLLSDSAQKDQSLERMKQLLKPRGQVSAKLDHRIGETRLSDQTPGLGSAIRREMGILSGDRSAVSADDVVCMSTTTRPKLDGKFDDELWRTAFEMKAFLQMKNSDVVFFARDTQFLYLIARMNKQPDFRYDHQKKRRTRDANLQNRDRIEITLDCDRDGRTGFRLMLDHRGWVNESFDAISDWDPDWYVSQLEDDNSWTVEAAIPLAAFKFDSTVQQDSEISKPWLIKLNRRISDTDLWSDKVLPTNNHRSMWDLLQADVDAKVFVLD